ncbi:MAG TPA: PadR family transcriptional regulator [Candidatus Acidoferrum sp.]|jgi:DNA-binding PadR family transcriptional regulator
MRQLTNLEHVLLGMLSQESLSGYSLRKRFATTPLGHFSDSPGSIYPALQRLQRRGLLRILKEKPANGRRAQRFTATPKARGELRHWLHGIVTRHEVLANFDGLLLRFVFRAELYGNSSAREFVVDLGKQVQEIIQELETYLAGPGSALPTAGRLAVESGLEGYRGSMRWIERAAAELGRSKS